MKLPIEGSRLRLREWTSVDGSLVLDLLGSADTMANMPHRRVNNIAEASVWLRKRLAQQEAFGITMFALESLEKRELVGACGAFPQGDDLELAWIVDHRHRSRGYAGEAGEMLLSALRDEGLAPRLYATIRPDNHHSRRVAGRLGMTITEELLDDRGALLVYRLGTSETVPAPRV